MDTPGLATAAGAISATSIVLGAHVDSLIVGLMAAIFVSTWLDSIDNKLKSAAAALFAAMLAAYGSPVVAGWLVTQLPGISTNGEPLRMLLAVIIGGLAPLAIPLLLRAATRKADSI